MLEFGSFVDKKVLFVCFWLGLKSHMKSFCHTLPMSLSLYTLKLNAKSFCHMLPMSVSKYLTISWRIPSGCYPMLQFSFVGFVCLSSVAPIFTSIFLCGFCMFVCSSNFRFNFPSVCMFSSLWLPSLILQVSSVRCVETVAKTQ